MSPKKLDTSPGDMEWLRVGPDAVRDATPRGQRALGTLMEHFGVSMKALLYQFAELGLLTFEQAEQLAARLSAQSVRQARKPSVGGGGREAVSTSSGQVRVPRRLLEVALDGARSGSVGTAAVAVLLERDDDAALFDEVMFSEPWLYILTCKPWFR